MLSDQRGEESILYRGWGHFDAEVAAQGLDGHSYYGHELLNADFVDHILADDSRFSPSYVTKVCVEQGDSTADPIDLTGPGPYVPPAWCIPMFFNPTRPGQLPPGLYSLFPNGVLMEGTMLPDGISSSLKGGILPPCSLSILVCQTVAVGPSTGNCFPPSVIH